MRRVIIAGDRNWNDHELYQKLLLLMLQMPNDVEILHGDCRGVDRAAGQIAQHLGFQVRAFPADFSQGKWAGPARNKAMLDEGVQAVYLFHKNIFESRGTADMKRQAETRGIPTVLIE